MEYRFTSMKLAILKNGVCSCLLCGEKFHPKVSENTESKPVDKQVREMEYKLLRHLRGQHERLIVERREKVYGQIDDNEYFGTSRRWLENERQH